MKVTIADGKYTVVYDEVKGLRALRYGEEWRDLTGDNLVAELAREIEELRAALQSQDLEDAALRQHITNLATIVRMPNAEYVADKHNDAVKYLRAKFIDHARRIERG